MQIVKLIFILLMALIWWGGMFAIIKSDQKRRSAELASKGEVNFQEKSILPYLLLGLICGALILPVYFGATRRSWKGFLVGLLWDMGLGFAVNLIYILGTVITGIR
jgi:hypothetical protein